MQHTHHLNFDELYMGIAIITSKKSCDPRTQVGAVIVDSNNIVLGIGYNGTPRGADNSMLNLNTEEKYNYMIHAEMNALLNCSSRPVGSTVYITLEPCVHCYAALLNSQIQRVVFLIHRECEKRDRLLSDSIKMEQFGGNLDWIADAPTVNGTKIF